MLTYQTLSVILAISAFVAIIAVGFGTSILREKPSFEPKEKKSPKDKERTYPLSFSRTQLWLWSLVIIPCFILYWGHIAHHVPSFNETGLVLLGISIGTGFTSWTITEVHLNSKPKRLELKKDILTKGWLIDLLMDDSGHISVTRLQQLIFTAAYIVIYVVTFFSNDMIDYPTFDNMALSLMGISAGGYLLAKGVYK